MIRECSILIIHVCIIASCTMGCNKATSPILPENMATSQYAKEEWKISGCLVFVSSSNIQVSYNGIDIAGDNLPQLLNDLGNKKGEELDVSILCDKDVCAYRFLNVLQDISGSHSLNPCIKIVAQGKTGGFYYFPYCFPIMDGGRAFPWYRILVRETGAQDNDDNDLSVRTNATLPGYAMMTIHIMQEDYIISQTRQTPSYVKDLLRAMKKEYQICAVNLAPQGNVTFQRVVDTLDLCADQELISYAFSTEALGVDL